MDQCMLDVSHIPCARIWDEVILMGTPRGAAPDGEEMSRLMDTIAHEMTCQVTRSIPRVYTRNVEMVAVKNYLA